jgi:hypothetical protein
MDRGLLGASLLVGILVYLCRFLPGQAAGAAAAVRPPAPSVDPRLWRAAGYVPAVLFLLALVKAGPVFSYGQHLAYGIVLGALASLLAGGFGRRRMTGTEGGASPSAPAAVAFASALGMGTAVVAAALFLLRASVLDGLAGVAIGWFCAAFPLYLGLPEERRDGLDGLRLVYGAGLTTTLAAAAMLGVFRDPLTPELAKLTWSGSLTAFAAFGALIVAGVTLPSGGRTPTGAGRLTPLLALVLAGGLGLALLSARVLGDLRFLAVGAGGLLLWPVALALLREEPGSANPAGRSFAVPLLPVVLVTAGFLAAVQALQGVGAALFVLSLFVALPATFALAPGLSKEAADGEERPLGPPALALLLFGTLLLLWRLFVTRWDSELRGVTLTDQYALFGIVVGAAFPALAAALPVRLRGAVPLLTLALCGLLALAAPGAVLLLFGPKSLAALLIGLALGAALAREPEAGGPSLLAGLLALAAGLALCQFTGRVLPDDDPTRVEKIRWLIGLMAVVAAAVLGTSRLGTAAGSDPRQQKGA